MADDESLVELRCSVVVVRGNAVLLLRRSGSRSESDGDWVLPGGRPRPREGLLSCARREVQEETGLRVNPTRCAFVAEVIAPDEEGRRVVEVVFVAVVSPHSDVELVGEEGRDPVWVGLHELRGLPLQPPIGGHLPSLVRGSHDTAPYLGNLWRPESGVRDRD